MLGNNTTNTYGTAKCSYTHSKSTHQTEVNGQIKASAAWH